MALNSKNWVISIGVNDSRDHESLKCPHFDAGDVFSIISKNWKCDSQNKILLTGNQATTKNINIILNEVLMRMADENDRIFIYLSGHVNTNVRSVTGSFVSYDYCKEKRNFGLNLRSLRYIVEDSRAKYIIVVIDGCSSGVIAQGNKNNTPHWFYFTTGEMDSEASTKLFITAVSSGKHAYEHEDKRNSEFTRILVDTISPFIKRKESLSTTLFYEFLVKKSKKYNMYPVKSGVEIGYTNFIESNHQDNVILSDDNKPYIPKWIEGLFDNCKNNSTVNNKDKSVFVRDNNFADGSRLTIGQIIKKSWRIRNAGNVSWKSRFLKMIGQSRGTGRIHCNNIIPIPDAEPNQEIDIEIELRMPPYPCSVYAEFKMTDSSGNILFPNQRGLYVTFDVIDPASQNEYVLSSSDRELVSREFSLRFKI
ncbi:MAG: NBR1-Ig-like domain-containing protein [Candidatus Electrothrix sp. GW3-4]|uniref:NBR1-Ig-like domain-containing protein n=1 Tax=Candidatus Electrothrix sp. GW3-4 TaxID=3126740 RepID=UPI0030CD345C